MSDETHVCEHEGCSSTETDSYTNQWERDTVDEAGNMLTGEYWFCGEHAVEEGYCLWCRLFAAGSEDYDFSPLKGYHRDCYDDLRAEVGEDDEDDDGFDYYPPGWSDPDIPSFDDDPTPKYIGSDSEYEDQQL